MSENPIEPIRNRGDIQPRESLLDQAFSSLSREEQDKLRYQIMEKRIGLEVDSAEALARFQNTRADINNALNTAAGLDRDSPKAGYDIHVESDSASGKTKIHIKKSSVAAGCSSALVLLLTSGALLYSIVYICFKIE